MFSRTDFPSISPCSDDSTLINMHTIQASNLTPWFIFSSDLISYGGGLATKSCRTLAILWTVAYQAPLSVGFSRQELWGDLPFPPPGDLFLPHALEFQTLKLSTYACFAASRHPLCD